MGRTAAGKAVWLARWCGEHRRTLFAAFSVSGVLGAAAGFSRWADRSTLAYRTPVGNAFGVYYVHPLVLYPAAWLRRARDAYLPESRRRAQGHIALSLAISAGVLRRAPILRRMF